MRTFAVSSPVARVSPSWVVRPSIIQRKCACSREDSQKEEPSIQAGIASGTPSRGHDFSRIRVNAASEPRGGQSPALTLGRADDPAEHEADAIATAIIRGERPSAPRREPPTRRPVQAKGANGAPCPSQDEFTEEQRAQYRRAEEEEPETVQAKADGASAGTSLSASFVSALAAREGGGTPLPGALQSLFQSRLGSPLGGVRLHTGPEDGHLARSIGAEAFTSGEHVYFAPGRYAPENAAGRHLLAHELVHVVQQRGRSSPTPVRRFTLSGFDPTQTSEMNRAIPVAKSKVLGCSGISVSDRADIVRGLNKADFVFVPEQEECGHTHPFTDTIKIGPSAFVHSSCCDLESTLAHECGHSFAWMIESSCRKMECKCFGCSC